MKLKIKKKLPEDKKFPWDKGHKRSGSGTPRRPEDCPPHIAYKTWKPIPGKEPVAADMASLKKLAVYMQQEVLRFFVDGHLHTGDFQRWVRANKGNTMAFYSWVIKDLATKSVQLSVIGGDGKTPDEMPLVVRIEQRKEAKK